MEEKNVIQTNKINWYPGHMEKAKRQMSEQIKLVDMVIELRDARIPNSSINPVLNEIIGNKPRLVILGKKDKADENITKQFLSALNEKYYAISLDLTKDRVTEEILKASKIIMKEKIDKLKAKGLKNVEIKAMVVGIPNVGKSTLINATNKKKAAKVENHPGVTKNLQWIKISSELSLLDTPGVLWPKFDDEITGYKLAIIGSINDSILPMNELVIYALRYLDEHYPNGIETRYGVKTSLDPYETYDAIAKARLCLLEDGKIDHERCDKMIIKDIRDGNLGRISWEKVDENKE